MLQYLFIPYFLVVVVSFTVAIGLVLTRSLHGKYSYDEIVGAQKIHQSLVPRIGGISIFLGFWFAQTLLPSAAIEVLAPTLALGLIAFTFGLIEDLSKKVPVIIRLWATLIPGVVGYILTSYSLKHFGFDWVDFLLQWSIFSIAFTAFAVCGVTHAINIIDGLNGLASWSVIWILAGMSVVATQVGDHHLALVSGVLLASTLGFLLLNWPWGKLFLGDSGSYLLGSAIAWLAVALVNRNPEISPFFCLLLCSYPIIETLYSIFRRYYAKVSSGQPDKMHLHQLVAIGLLYPKYRGKLNLNYMNSLAGLLVSLFSIPGVLLAVWFSQNQALLITFFFLNGIIYIASYRWARSHMYAQDQQVQRERSASTPNVL